MFLYFLPLLGTHVVGWDNTRGSQAHCNQFSRRSCSRIGINFPWTDAAYLLTDVAGMWKILLNFSNRCFADKLFLFNLSLTESLWSRINKVFIDYVSNLLSLVTYCCLLIIFLYDILTINVCVLLGIAYQKCSGYMEFVEMRIGVLSIMFFSHTIPQS